MQVTRRAFTVAPPAIHPRNILHLQPLTRTRLHDCPPQEVGPYKWRLNASFSHCARTHAEGRFTGAAKDLHQQSNEAQETDLNTAIAQQKEKQTKAPWHREGSNTPPVARQRSAGAMTKGKYASESNTFEEITDQLSSPGKLLTTPSRLLKLVIPLTTLDKNSDRKDVEPLALLVHPQQPLSYLERLIQSELPTITTARGEEKIPAVHFRAEDSPQDEILPGKEKVGKDEDADSDLEESKFDGKNEKTGKLNRRKKTSEVAKQEEESHQTLGDGSVEKYSGLGHEASSSSSYEDHNRNFVRWSPSTEIGDFIRDAARGKEFAVEIEGAPNQIRIGVPSFNDRTHYLRQRLRKTSAKIMDLAAIKRECDIAAHKGAQRVAVGGAGLLVGY
ncbi:MAG: hypothetical protein Q9225_002210, partial [Loekoesia sp. 1 TL-2023]